MPRRVEDGTTGVDRLQPVPLYHQIFLQLRGEIATGERAVGSRLPTEQELSESFVVSRITARRSLDELAQAGLVARNLRENGRGEGGERVWYYVVNSGSGRYLKRKKIN